MLSWPYIVHIENALLPLAVTASAVLVVTALAVPVLRRRGLPPGDQTGDGQVGPARGRCPALRDPDRARPRPYVHPVPVMPGLRPRYRAITWHHYLQFSLHWVFWYAGVPAVLLAALGAAALTRTCLRGGMRLGAAAQRVRLDHRHGPVPAGIVPHQPWASRRLVPGVLPGLILLAIWGASWLIAWARRHDYGPVASGAIPLCAAALVVPAAMTTFGLGVRDGGPLGIRPSRTTGPQGHGVG